MTAVLIIGSEEQTAIDAALAAARANPIPWEVFKDVVDKDASNKVLLKNRRPGVDAVRAKYPPQNVMLGTYRAAISFEQQPTGLFRHLSVSSANPRAVPGPQVLSMVCIAFGFSRLLAEVVGSSYEAEVPKDMPPFRVWMEEFEPRRIAINIVEIVSK